MHHLRRQPYQRLVLIFSLQWLIITASCCVLFAFLQPPAPAHHESRRGPQQQNNPWTSVGQFDFCPRLGRVRLQSSSRTELENEEPLSVMFQRAVVLQRAGSHDDALEEYAMFLKAAKQCQVDPSMYAEVYGNMGALYLRKQQWDVAREHLQQALQYRPKFGTAHVNLAVVALQQASTMPSATSSYSDANEAISLIQSAQKHCNDALECNTDPRSVAMAQRLLQDIDKMLSSSSPPLE